MLQFLKQLLSCHFGSTVYNRAKVYNVNFLKVVVIIIDQLLIDALLKAALLIVAVTQECC